MQSTPPVFQLVEYRALRTLYIRSTPAPDSEVVKILPVGEKFWVCKVLKVCGDTRVCVRQDGDVQGWGSLAQPDGTDNMRADPPVEPFPVAANQISSPPYVMHAGWVEKQTHFLKQWKMRFFILAPKVLTPAYPRRHLYYYADQNSPDPKDIVPVEMCTVHRQTQAQSGKPFSFEMRIRMHSKDNYIVACETEQQLLEWQQVLESSALGLSHYQEPEPEPEPEEPKQETMEGPPPSSLVFTVHGTTRHFGHEMIVEAVKHIQRSVGAGREWKQVVSESRVYAEIQTLVRDNFGSQRPENVGDTRELRVYNFTREHLTCIWVNSDTGEPFTKEEILSASPFDPLSAVESATWVTRPGFMAVAGASYLIRAGPQQNIHFITGESSQSVFVVEAAPGSVVTASAPPAAAVQDAAVPLPSELARLWDINLSPDVLRRLEERVSSSFSLLPGALDALQDPGAASRNPSWAEFCRQGGHVIEAPDQESIAQCVAAGRPSQWSLGICHGDFLIPVCHQGMNRSQVMRLALLGVVRKLLRMTTHHPGSTLGSDAGEGEIHNPSLFPPRCSISRARVRSLSLIVSSRSIAPALQFLA